MAQAYECNSVEDQMTYTVVFLSPILHRFSSVHVPTVQMSIIGANLSRVRRSAACWTTCGCAAVCAWVSIASARPSRPHLLPLKPTGVPTDCRCSRCRLYIHTHTRLTALFRDHPGEPVPERWNQPGFYWSKRQWVEVASAGPYASLHLAPYR